MLTMQLSTGTSTGTRRVPYPLPSKPKPSRALDRRGYYRSPITMPEYRKGQAPANKGRKFPAEPLTTAEVLAMIDACGKGAAGSRNRALIMLLWRSGLRITEALQLEPKDIDRERRCLRVLHGKGDKARVVAIDAAALAVVDDWMETRRKLGIGRNRPVFCVISKPTIGEPVHSAYVRNMVKACARKAGIEHRVHPHGLRHTHAYQLLEAGVRVDHIQGQLGHTSLQTTARYLDHLNPSERISAISELSWPDA